MKCVCSVTRIAQRWICQYYLAERGNEIVTEEELNEPEITRKLQSHTATNIPHRGCGQQTSINRRAQHMCGKVLSDEQNPSDISVGLNTTSALANYATKAVLFVVTRREPEDTKSQDADRDIFNEKPSKEDIISATEASGVERLYESAILHTALGDITIKLFGKECPRAVENFCVHSKNGYYNSHIFHRVIKGFMVQTGDPTGTGTGGESIWGGEFEDEFNSSLRHDRPYTLSMANAGPNTNGSQFFITLIPTPWLDNKHTVFGRVVKGMEVVQNISTVKTNPKTDKPYDDIQIVSITLK
uniref:Peptidyl-prolyl cis-trans isomerase n=1 Tax=Timema douglasi TaxID=61478 RepID=A0A7R8VJP7_TIMDO|nr:unnamed protein product [Timema douglasi]